MLPLNVNFPIAEDINTLGDELRGTNFASIFKWKATCTVLHSAPWARREYVRRARELGSIAAGSLLLLSENLGP